MLSIVAFLNVGSNPIVVPLIVDLITIVAIVDLSIIDRIGDVLDNGSSQFRFGNDVCLGRRPRYVNRRGKLSAVKQVRRLELLVKVDSRLSARSGGTDDGGVFVNGLQHLAEVRIRRRRPPLVSRNRGAKSSYLWRQHQVNWWLLLWAEERATLVGCRTLTIVELVALLKIDLAWLIVDSGLVKNPQSGFVYAVSKRRRHLKIVDLISIVDLTSIVDLISIVDLFSIPSRFRLPSVGCRFSIVGCRWSISSRLSIL